MSAADKQGEYPGRLAANPVTAAAQAIDLGCRKLMAPGARLNDPALFDYRVKADAIRAWRHGRRQPPRWALDLMAAKLMAHGAAFHAVAELARSAPGFMGHTGAAGKLALNRWRAAQAAKKNLPNP